MSASQIVAMPVSAFAVTLTRISVVPLRTRESMGSVRLLLERLKKGRSIISCWSWVGRSPDNAAKRSSWYSPRGWPARAAFSATGSGAIGVESLADLEGDPGAAADAAALGGRIDAA